MKVPVVGMLLKRACVAPSALWRRDCTSARVNEAAFADVYDHPRRDPLRGSARPQLPNTHQRPPAKLGDVAVGISIRIDAIVVLVEVAEHRDEVVFTRRCAQVDGRSSRLIGPTAD